MLFPHLKIKLTILSFLYVFLLGNDKIQKLGDWNFDYYTKNSDKRWLIVLYMERCGHCITLHRDVLDTLEWDLSKASVGTVNCGEFRSTCQYRFGIQYIPVMYVIENNLIYDYPFDTNSKENVLKFLTMPLDIANGRPVPAAESLYTTLTRDTIAFIDKIHPKVQQKLEGVVEWNSTNYTLGLLIGIILLGIIMLFMILKVLCNCCCRNKKTSSIDINQSIKKEPENIKKNN